MSLSIENDTIIIHFCNRLFSALSNAMKTLEDETSRKSILDTIEEAKQKTEFLVNIELFCFLIKSSNTKDIMTIAPILAPHCPALGMSSLANLWHAVPCHVIKSSSWYQGCHGMLCSCNVDSKVNTFSRRDMHWHALSGYSRAKVV